MKLGFKFSLSAATILFCFCVNSADSTNSPGFLAVFSGILAGTQYGNALPPSLFHKRLGSPMPQIGGPISLNEDEDSDEDEQDLLDDENESLPRVEPHITPLNRDQCLAKLLCGMSVPVTGGSSKKNYYNEYASTVSKFFEAFPLDDEFQSKESIETYDDYSNEDDGKPTRMNSRRKPLNSSRVTGAQPSLQLFDLALVDVAKPEDIAKNRTKKAEIEKVHSGHRIARARRIVENLGQKLQTVRQCQAINGCPFTFKQLKEKIKKKETQKISSNVPLQQGPVWTGGPKHRPESPVPPKPYNKPISRPRPIPPVSKPDSSELFSPEEPAFPFKDTNKGDDEMEELFGPAPVSKKPLGFHQGVDEHFNYEYSSDKPWRPGQSGGHSYSHQPWKTKPRPQPKPFSGGNSQRLPPRPRPPHRPGGPTQKRQPQPNRRPNLPAPAQAPRPRPKTPVPAPKTTQAPMFPKKKVNYLSSPYKKPVAGSTEDDEGAEDINKVAPVQLIGNLDAGEAEPEVKPSTTEKPKEEKKKKKDEDEDSDEYDDDYNDDDYDDDDAIEDDDDEYSDEEDEEDKKKAKKTKEATQAKREKKKKEEKKEEEDEEEEEEEEDEDEKKPTTTTTSTPKPFDKEKLKKQNKNPNFDDETADVDEIWTKLSYATTGANYKPPEKLKKPGEEEEEKTEDAKKESEEDDDAEEEDDNKKKSLAKAKPASSSASDEDDEVDDDNASKPKKKKKNYFKSKPKPKPKEGDDDDDGDDEVQNDLPEPPAPKSEKKEETSPTSTKKPKAKKKSKKPAKKGSSEEEDLSANTRRKQMMMEIGGRPLVPKPDNEYANAQKTTSLIGNRFKFSMINPYAPALPQDSNPQGSYSGPMRSSVSGLNSNGAGASLGSSLPFKFKINPGALGGIGGFSSLGSSSASGSVEMPDPHHPPPSSGYIPPPSHKNQHQQQRQDIFSMSHGSLSHGGLSGMGGLATSALGGSSFFKNPLPALSKMFKRPSYDPTGGLDHNSHSPPPMAAFVHRPVGPESSQFKREKFPSSPASGTSSPASSSTSKKKGKSNAEKKRKL